MSFQDKSIQCSDCDTTFTFSVEDQEFYQSKGYTNEPKRCPECRQARKSERYGNSSYGAPRQMFPATCACVVKAPKFLLNLAVIGRCTVAIATEKSDQVDKLV